MLINERNAFSDHYKVKDQYKKVFTDSSEKPITKKNINYKPSEFKAFAKIKGDIAKEHCTKKDYIKNLEEDEAGEVKYNLDGTIAVEIQYFHESRSSVNIINLKKIDDQLKKYNFDGIVGFFKLEKFLKNFYCIKSQGERKSIYSKNSVLGKTIIDNDLIEKGLTIPEGILIQEPLFEILIIEGDDAKEDGKAEPEPSIEKFKEALRNELFAAAKEKLDGFDTKILEIHMVKSKHPIFFRNLSRNGEKKFDIKYNNESAGQRYLDDFYVRRGGSKKLIDKSQDIYQYIKNRT